MAKTEYEEADEVEQIARELIAEHHLPLMTATILYFYRIPGATSKGKTVFGKARKASPMEQALSPECPDLIIEINGEEWPEMTETTKRALVDHELCHFAATHDKDGAIDGWKIEGHDFEDFTAIVDRHGAWSTALYEAGKALSRLDIFARSEVEARRTDTDD